jgi:hypothetical protein
MANWILQCSPRVWDVFSWWEETDEALEDGRLLAGGTLDAGRHDQGASRGDWGDSCRACRCLPGIAEGPSDPDPPVVLQAASPSPQKLHLISSPSEPEGLGPVGTSWLGAMGGQPVWPG